MTQHYKQACIFGGSGFIGRQIVRLLAKDGYTIKVASRAPEGAFFLKTAGNVGQVVPFLCDYAKDEDLARAVEGCDLVINCIGILYERRRGDFVRVHTELPRRLSKACRDGGVSKFIHLSALGCDQAFSKYGKSKYAGEQAIFENFPAATMLRPSVVFGAEDNFFNMFARLSVIAPFLPLIGGGKTKFQPVYVGDVASAVMSAAHSVHAGGKIYELGGPDIVTFKDIYQKLFAHTGRPRALLPLPWGLAKIQGHVMGALPSPLLTADQVESLKTDTVVTPQALGLKDLGISPTAMEIVLPTYLARYRPGGRFGDKKRA